MTDGNETAPLVPASHDLSINIENSDPNDSNRINCWVCFGGVEDEGGEWVRPCKCRGTTQWVHQACLQRWIDEKQKGNSSASVACPQCNTEYILLFPPFGRLVYALDMADRIIYKVCPLATAGVVVGSIYWTAVTYGAITVMQTLGSKEGLQTMEQADPLVLLVGLPTIPIMLVLGKMVRWEDFLLRLWRRHSARLPKFIGRSSPSPPGEDHSSGIDVAERLPPGAPALSDPVSATRVLCGALLFPTAAALFGRLLFSHIQHNPQRTLLGGITFIAVKGVLKMYLRQQQYARQCQRKIMNYEVNKAFPHESPTTSQSSQTDSSSSSDF